jgi:hypothetical protein
MSAGFKNMAAVKVKKEKLDEEAAQSSEIRILKKKRSLSHQALTQKAMIHRLHQPHHRHHRHTRHHCLHHLIKRRRKCRRETSIVTSKVICTVNTKNSQLDKNLTGKIRY